MFRLFVQCKVSTKNRNSLMQPCLFPILGIEPQTIAARTSEEVRGGARFFPGLPHGVQSRPRYPCFYGRAVSCNGELHHQNSKNQPLSVGFFSPVPASTGADSGHGLLSTATPHPSIFTRFTPLCLRFYLLASGAPKSANPVSIRVCGLPVLLGNCPEKTTEPAADVKKPPCGGMPVMRGWSANISVQCLALGPPGRKQLAAQ